MGQREGRDRIYIIGHRQPDTDCIASVIAYAELLNLEEPERYFPARCGELNTETCFALETFRSKPPVLVESLTPLVSDLAIHRISVTENVPTGDVAALMDTHDIRNVPVTDDQGKLVGVVGEHGLARTFVGRLKTGELAIAPLPLATLARILSARIAAGPAAVLGGRVIIVVDAPESIRRKVTKKDIAVVGENETMQLTLIESGIAGLIIVDGAQPGDRVIARAQENGVPVLLTDLDAFGVGTLISLSLPARMVMEKDIPRLSGNDTISQAKQTVYGSRFRSACVVDNDGTLRGIVTRTTLLSDVHKKVILLDHNEFTQAVDGIDDAEILEIIDHHRLGAISTLKPVKFLNDPVGSTSTIIAKKYQSAGITPRPEIAGLLLAGILSDTLLLRMSTTTADDREAAAFLAPLAGTDPVQFGTTLLEQGMNLAGSTMEDLLVRDTKRYDLFGRKVVIAQVMVPSFMFHTAHAEAIRRELAGLRIQHGADLYLGMFTSTVENGSELFAAADSQILARLELKDQPIPLPTMMSRKKDLVPWFGEKLRSLS